MAKQIEPGKLPAKRKGAPSKYPWDQWTNGNWWLALQGEDFTCALESFRSTLFHQAKRRGVTVETRTTDNEAVAFRFSTPVQEALKTNAGALLATGIIAGQTIRHIHDVVRNHRTEEPK